MEVDVGLLRKLLKSGQQARRSGSPFRPFGVNGFFRTCRVEQMEPRRLLAAVPIQLGAVYFEDRSGQDQEGDAIEVTWSGGAGGTQLAELVIEGDKLVDGLTGGDTFFDTEPGGLGVYGAVGLSIVQNSGVDSISSAIVDGGTALSLVFGGFDAGDRLVLDVDVDEYQDAGNGGPSAFAEGAEFEGALLTATFTADYYYDAVDTGVFQDQYVVAAGLDLPDDDYVPPSTTPVPIQTAGVMLAIQQTPLPVTISGTVFDDWDMNNSQEPGEPGIQGVALSLFIEEAGQWVDTGQTAITDAFGDYGFEDLLPGTYRIVETQPGGYLSVGAAAGTVGGAIRGVVVTVDEIADITLLGGDDSVENNFAETQPVGLSGYVYHDTDNDGVREPGEEGIGGVSMRVPDRSPGATPGATISTTTGPDGYWEIDDLYPGEYWIEETQPAGFLDGVDSPGTAGGTAHNPGDRIDGFQLVGGQQGSEYNFGEFRPASIAGTVYADLDGDWTFDPGEPLLEGVTIYLLDASGGRIASTTTDPGGEYAFTDLPPGTYGVEEIQPEDYIHGQTFPGSAGGILDGPDRIIDAQLSSGANAVGYDFCELVPASISGYVFKDGPTIQVGLLDPLPDPASVRDGQFTPDDSPIAGVVLQLGNVVGAPVLGDNGQPITTVTDANGYYQFTNLRPGVYTVYEIHPEGYVDSIDTPGSNGGEAFNPHDPPDPLKLMLFVGEHQNDAITRIHVGPGDSATDYNFSEVLYDRTPAFFPDTPDPPSPPPTGPAAPLLPPASGAVYYPVPPQIVIQPAMFIGSGGPGRYTWHLSVINGGQPRRSRIHSDKPTDPANPYFNPETWTGQDIDRGRWVIANSRGVPQKEFGFGLPDAIPVAGDFNGDGVDEIGVYINGVWFVDLDADGVWDRDDFWAKLGRPGDLPVVGDWDGDGKTDIATFGPAWIGDSKAIQAEPGLPTAKNVSIGRPKNVPPDPEEATIGWRLMKRTAKSTLRSDLIDHVFEFGLAGDKPVAGDFNGDGVATIAIFRGGVWFLDIDGDGRWSKGDLKVKAGRRGDVPLVGDFNNDGIDDLGVYRAGVWHLDTNGDRRLDAHDKVFRLGGPLGQPVVGDFDGDGTDEVAVYQNGAAALPGHPVRQQETQE